MGRSTRLAAALLLSIVVAWALACGGPDPSPQGDSAAAEAKRLRVSTTSSPVHWLVERIGGEQVEVVNILPPGQDPQHWQPSSKEVAELSDVDLVVINGAGFEAWVGTATLPVSRLVDTTRGLELIEVEGATHSHGVAGKHSHVGDDPHTWSDPLVYLAQAEAVHAALVRTDPENREFFDRGLEALATELQTLDRDYAQVLDAGRGRRMAANHPAYNYLARRYGLDLRSFDFDPESAPSEEQLRRLADWAADSRPLVLWWEAAPGTAVADAFPAWVRHEVIDPLEQPGEGTDYDYLRQARANLAAFEAFLEEE